MTIIKIELVEGDELMYKNPSKVDQFIGPDLSLLSTFSQNVFVLSPDETIIYHIKPKIPIYVVSS
jgi:hypothetical protein